MMSPPAGAGWARAASATASAAIADAPAGASLGFTRRDSILMAAIEWYMLSASSVGPTLPDQLLFCLHHSFKHTQATRIASVKLAELQNSSCSCACTTKFVRMLSDSSLIRKFQDGKRAGYGMAADA